MEALVEVASPNFPSNPMTESCRRPRGEAVFHRVS